MPSKWLVKTEPGTYSFDDLIEDKKTVWNGITNNLALIHMRNMKKGDLLFVYHTGRTRSVVGIAEVVRGPYRRSSTRDPNTVVVDVKARNRLNKHVSLKEIRKDRRLAAFDLVKVPRLSVMPVAPGLWNIIIKMGQGLASIQ